MNNDKDLAVCRREINIISNLTGHKNLICYVDSQINQTEAKVHEVLLDVVKAVFQEVSYVVPENINHDLVILSVC